eukprot:14588263-Heterocapsa_arctica.AAC.1
MHLSQTTIQEGRPCPCILSSAKALAIFPGMVRSWDSRREPYIHSADMAESSAGCCGRGIN